MPSSHCCLKPTKGSMLLTRHHRTMPKHPGTVPSALYRLSVPPQFTLPVLYLKLQPHRDIYNPLYTSGSFSPLLLFKLSYSPECLPPPPHSSRLSSSSPSSRKPSLPTPDWVRHLSFMLPKGLLHLSLSLPLTNCFKTFSFSESFPHPMNGR